MTKMCKLHIRIVTLLIEVGEGACGIFSYGIFLFNIYGYFACMCIVHSLYFWYLRRQNMTSDPLELQCRQLLSRYMGAETLTQVLLTTEPSLAPPGCFQKESQDHL